MTLKELELIVRVIKKVPMCNDPNCKICPDHKKAVGIIEREYKLKTLNPTKGQ